MREVTLETLLADFEAARAAVGSKAALLIGPDLLAELWDCDPSAITEDALVCRKAAKLYLIARDEGLDKAALWKLANG